MEFLKTHRDVALATVEGDRPKIRVFQIMLQEGTTLYFATSAKKEVYRQLQQNPNVELLAMDGDISVRVTGRACFDVTDDIACRIYEGYKAMVYFRLPVTAVDYYDLAPTPPVLEHWER